MNITLLSAFWKPLGKLWQPARLLQMRCHAVYEVTPVLPAKNKRRSTPGAQIVPCIPEFAVTKNGYQRVKLAAAMPLGYKPAK